MPAFARRRLPLTCRVSPEMALLANGWRRPESRPERAAWSPAVDSRSRMGREWKKISRRWMSVGVDWQCTGTCTVTGRNLIDEWKTLGRNQR